MKYIAIFLTLVLSACASQQVQQPIHQSAQQIVQKELDLDKVKTVNDLSEIIKLLFPKGLFLNVREDSVADQKQLESVKHLIKVDPKPAIKKVDPKK